MLTLKRILLPTDGSACSRQAMAYALSLAQQYGSHVITLHVGWERPVERGVPESAPDVLIKVQQEAAAEAERLLREVAEADA